jgi:HEAT repeat protein
LPTLKTLQSWLQRLTPEIGAGPKLSSDQRKELLAALHSDRPAERWLAAEALAEGDPGRDGVAALAALLSDPDPLLRSEAARGLGQIGGKGARQSLLDAAAAGDVLAQAAAADGLGALPPTAEAVAALAGLLASRDAAVRQSAAEALARLDPPPPAKDGSSAAPAIQATLLTLLASDDAPMARRAAALALGRWGNGDVEPALTACRDDNREDSLVRAAAALALARPRRPASAPQEGKVDTKKHDKEIPHDSTSTGVHPSG